MSQKNFDNPKLGKNYLLDLIAIVKEEAFHGINEYKHSQSKIGKNQDSELDRGYLDGYAHAYSRVISIMFQLAMTYNIPLSELHLNDIDPDKDLLPGV